MSKNHLIAVYSTLDSCGLADSFYKQFLQRGQSSQGIIDRWKNRDHKIPYFPQR